MVSGRAGAERPYPSSPEGYGLAPAVPAIVSRTKRAENGLVLEELVRQAP